MVFYIGGNLYRSSFRSMGGGHSGERTVTGDQSKYDEGVDIKR